MTFAICNELFEGWPFDRVCRFVREVGYDGLEIAPFTLAPRITDVSAADRAALRRNAADAGIEIVGLHWLLARTDGFYLTSPDRAVRHRTAQYFIALAQACHDLGGSLMVLGSPKQRSLLPGVTTERALDYASDVLAEVVPTLADLDVTLCLEPLSRDETNFLNTCAEAAALVDRLGHPNIAIHLDVKAMSSESTPVLELIRCHAAHAGHFHANDRNLRGPGFGDTDFVPIFKALDDAGYDRWVSVEVFDNLPDPETIARKSVQYMKECRAKELSA